jgi:hypothetical protein
VLDLDKKKPVVKRLLKDLDNIDLYEWAHFKKSKALRMVEKSKYDEAVDLFAEIFCGIEDDGLEEEVRRRILDIKEYFFIFFCFQKSWANVLRTTLGYPV